MMFRTIFLKPYQNLILQTSFKNVLLARNSCFGAANEMMRSTVYCSCYSSSLIHHNKNNHNCVPFISYHNVTKLIHTNHNTSSDSALKSMKVPPIKLPDSIAALDLGKASEEFFKIKMVHLKEAPLPAFWLGFSGLLPFMFPPISSLIFGYSSALSTVQLAYGIAILSHMGGIKWGSLISQDKQSATWENYGLSVIPSFIATFAIILPKSLGFIVVIAGLLAAFVIDLTTSRYPPWFIALRGVLTNVSVFFLFISLLQCILWH